MDFNMWAASVPVFVNSLTDMRAWLDKAAAEKDKSALLEARLAPDMRPLPAQYQMASDSAKNALARLTGTEAPAMPDTEQSFAELRDRCDKTIAYLNGFDANALNGSKQREVVLKFPEWSGLPLHRRRLSDGLCAAELLLPRHHGLRDPAQCRRVARQAGFPPAPRPAEPLRLAAASRALLRSITLLTLAPTN